MGLFLLIGGLATIAWLSSNMVQFGTKAATANIPQAIQISNISESSFSVSYFTQEKVTGTLTYGLTPEMGSVAFDDRDQATATASAYRVHHISVTGLSPETKYYFAISSGGDNLLKANTPYEITTAKQKTEPSTTHAPLTGEITLEDGKIPTEAIAYVSTNGSQLLSSLVQANGSYTLGIGHMLTQDLTKEIEITPETTFQMLLTDTILHSTVTFRPTTSSKVPLVILSKNYDFVAGSDPLVSPTGTSSAEITGFPLKETPGSGPAINTPTNNQTFDDKQPLFTGKAVPNAEVIITINSAQELTATVQADDTGNWKYKPAEPLDPGDHTITIASPDLSGIVQTITNSFVVHAEGSQFTEPSISPIQSPTPTVSTTPTDVPTPTASPTLTPSPTLPTATVSAQPTIQPTGSMALVISLFGILGAIGVGALLFFATMV